MNISRSWAMPSIWTFRIPIVAELLGRYMGNCAGWLDPFAGETSPAEVTNDIEGRGADYSMDALEFLCIQEIASANGVLFDPPYSVEQCLRRYSPRRGGTAGRAEYWARCKDEIARLCAPEDLLYLSLGIVPALVNVEVSRYAKSCSSATALVTTTQLSPLNRK